MKKHLVTALVPVLLLGLAGCSSGGGAAGDAPSPTAAVTTDVQTLEVGPEPTPTEISTEDAGAQYLALVEPFNVVAGTWSTVDQNDYAAIRAAAAEVAASQRTFADGLVASEWPASVQPTIDALVSELATETPIFLQIASSTTDQQLIDLTYAIPAQQGNGQKLRILLGLPDVPVS
ncbi:hypothetical protein [Oerskovia enterophila]|uniref:Lipoprotein n=1 Tax=Oerskovia enterophila TaxID=43678 RepID=A0A163QTL5_9CELL|nr:hypothetical protein [Oerskovia enterophila]KZM34512.1 hypothetical protein OJAG_28110 [Oerskovia enterophila]